jgi:hypothetical protein
LNVYDVGATNADTDAANNVNERIMYM